MRPMYGVTHDMSGEPRIVVPKTVKVGIGLAAGPSIYAYINGNKQWTVVVGKEGHTFPTKQEARAFYRQEKPGAPVLNYPRKVPFFIFTKVSPDGSFEPEWDVIESCGPIPTEIDIIFVTDEPFTASYQMWTKTEKKCEGDGKDAMRVLAMAQNEMEKQLVKEAQSAGEKYFPITNGCWMYNCPFSKAEPGKPSPCRPHGRLLFQLVSAMRLGGTAYYDTTGFRSISQIYSCLEQFKNVSGGRGLIAGVPIKMVLRPYKVTHEGKSATQYGVSLEFRANDAVELKSKLIDQAVRFHLAGGEPLKALSPAPEPVEIPVIAEEDDEVPPETAAAMAAEFYPETQPPDNEDFVDPELGGNGTEIATPQRKSETGGQQVNGGAQEQTQLIDPLWEQPKQEESPVIDPEIVQPEKPAKPENGKNQMRWNGLLQISRNKGIADRSLFEAMGRLGFERADEITDKGFEDLTRWIKDQKIKQQKLV